MTRHSAGVRMPAEWETHDATWLAWPHLQSDWPGKLDAVRWAFVDFVRKLQGNETVCLLVRDEREASFARSRVRREGADPDRLAIHACETDRSWLRDSGPTFVRRGDRLQAVCWRFTAWGRYPNWQRDERVGRHIAAIVGAEAVTPTAGGRRLTLEGGALECNGQGTLLTTEQCLLGDGGERRNPGLSRDDLEEALRKAIGVSNVVWLGQGIAGDDTSGHIDTLARFVGPSTVASVVERDSQDENWKPLRDNLRRLLRARDEQGRQLDVVELPMPRPVVFDGERLPASYANFYIANGCVLVPTFNDPNDSAAIRILQECFPEREVCGIHCLDIVLGLGALHCLAQQQPSAHGVGLPVPGVVGDNGPRRGTTISGNAASNPI